MIEVGQNLPEATLTESIQFGDACPLPPQKLSTTEAAANKSIVIFGLPGAYTPTCSANHAPGYIQELSAFKKLGVDEIWCVSVNDGYVMAAWGQGMDGIGKIRFLGDGSADFAKKLGLEVDLTAAGMGIRMKRSSMWVKNGVVQRVNVEAPGKFEVSDAKTMLAQLGA